MSHRAPVTPQCSAAVCRQAGPAGIATVSCPAGRVSRLHSQLWLFAKAGTQLCSSEPWEIPAGRLGSKVQHWAMEQCCRPPSQTTSAQSHSVKPRDVPIQVSHLLLGTAFGMSCALPMCLWSCKRKKENKVGVNPKEIPSCATAGRAKACFNFISSAMEMNPVPKPQSLGQSHPQCRTQARQDPALCGSAFPRPQQECSGGTPGFPHHCPSPTRCFLL